MTEQQYYAIVRSLGLRPTAAQLVYMDSSGDVWSVPDATRLTPPQRVEHIAMLKFLMGVGPKPF